jgi:serine/threonine protein kinase
VKLALTVPAEEREVYLRKACGGDTALFRETWDCVQWENRMKGILQDSRYASPQDEDPFRPGDLLDGRFRIVREIARGGMGIVYEATDEKLDRRIALKRARPGFQEQLPPEVRNATEISHPNVCKIFEIHTAATDEGNIDFITMEFLEGETLAERLRRGISKADAADIARQICAGMAEAHRNKVIHGDLKSNNIILTPDADGSLRAVIMDFGLARGADGLIGKATGRAGAGTPAYMAPELWKGGRPSTQSDVYALGIILQELTLGQVPHGSRTTALDPQQALQVQQRTPGLSRKWDRIVSRCLDPDPARRFRDASEVGRSLAP